MHPWSSIALLEWLIHRNWPLLKEYCGEFPKENIYLIIVFIKSSREIKTSTFCLLLKEIFFSKPPIWKIQSQIPVQEKLCTNPYFWYFSKAKNWEPEPKKFVRVTMPRFILVRILRLNAGYDLATDFRNRIGYPKFGFWKCRGF